jgi:predicted ATPase
LHPCGAVTGAIGISPEDYFFRGRKWEWEIDVDRSYRGRVRFQRGRGIEELSIRDTQFALGAESPSAPCKRLFARARDGYFFRAESFFNVATEIEKLDAEPANAPPIAEAYGDRALHEQSHGESFLALLTKKFRGEGLYFLDEPEAALSPTRQLSALVAIHELVKKSSQFIIATHSPILLAYPDAIILQFSEKGIEQIAYEETEHYQVTRRFLNDHRRQVNYLLADDLFNG